MQVPEKDTNTNNMHSDEKESESQEDDEHMGGESQQAGTVTGGNLPLRGLGCHSIQSHDNVSLLVQRMLGHYPHAAAATKTLSLCSRVRATSD